MIKGPSSASLLLSEDCNLACKYCFELGKRNRKHMTEEVAVKAVDFLYQNAIEDEGGSVGYTMFGGEPLLKTNILNKVVEQSLKMRDKTNIPFAFTIITNGTIMTDEVYNSLRWYNKNNIPYNLQLSVDGIREYHDINRVTRSNRGSFDIIEGNVERFKEAVGSIKNINVHGALNKETLPGMYEGYKYFTEAWGIPATWFMPINGNFWDEKDVEIYEQQLTLIANDILRKMEETKNFIYLEDYAPLNKALSPKSPPHTPCGAGKNYCVITAAGDTHPCHQFYFDEPGEDSRTGNIWDGIKPKKNRLFENYSAEDMYCSIDRDCQNTDCYRCIASFYANTGTILATEYGPRCDMMTIDDKITNEFRKILAEKKFDSTGLEEKPIGCPHLERYEHTNFDEIFKKYAEAEETF